MIRIIIAYYLLTLSGFAFGQADIVSLNNFDSKKLNLLLLDYTNQQRKRKRRDTIEYYPALSAAAKSQANYMAKNEYLGHYQKNRRLKTVKNRVQVLGGDADYVGENVQYISIQYELERLKGKLTYQALAKELGENWKKSKGHYANMIDKKYQGVAHQFAIKDGLLYACQVFSSKPFEPAFDYVKGVDFNVKNKKPCFDCKRTMTKNNKERLNFGWYYVSNDSVFYYNYKRTFYTYQIPFFRRTIFIPATKRNLHTIFKRKGKLSVDFIHLSQYNCVGKYAYSGALNYDGYYLGYINKKVIKKNDISPSKKYVQVYVGQIPESNDEHFQIDFFLTKQDRACASQSLIFVSPDYFKPSEYFQLKHPTISIGSENKVVDSIVVRVPFLRNQTSEDMSVFDDLQNQLNQLKMDSTTVFKVMYSGIASIEGTKSGNQKLIEKRAKAIENILSKYYKNIKVEHTLIENFNDFRLGLQAKEGDRWLNVSDEELRDYANKNKNKVKISKLLDESRQSVISVFYEKSYSTVELKPTIENLKRLVVENEGKAALLVYQQLTKKALDGDSAVTNRLHEVEVPFDSSFSELIWEQFVFNLKLYKIEVTAEKLNDLCAVGAIPTEWNYLEYRLMFNLFYDQEICNTSDFENVQTSVKSKNTKNWLSALQLINNFEQNLIYYDIGPELANYALAGKFNVYQTYFVSQYIISYGGLYYAKLLLEKYARQSRHFPKLYQQYLKLSYYFDGFENKRQLKLDLRVLKNLIKSDSNAFCKFFKWFHIGVRLLEKEVVSKLYCENCV